MKTINFAIDLGTTNSLVAKYDNGKIKIFNNPLGLKQTLPSCIAFRGNRIVIGDKALDYLEKDAEKLRKVGHQIRTLLDKDVLEIDIHGEEGVYHLAEGLLLSNYQFLKYFKDAKEKAYLLQKINWINGDKKQAEYLISNCNIFQKYFSSWNYF